MSRLGNYFYCSSFLRLLTGSGEEAKNISLNKMVVNSTPLSETNVVVKGLVDLTECNEYSIINDQIDFSCNISWNDIDSLSVITKFSVSRLESGDSVDIISCRDPLYELPFRDGSGDFVCEEYFIMIDGGKRLLHAREGVMEFETFELKEPNQIDRGVILDSVKVFDEECYDLEDPAIVEIQSLLPTEDAKVLDKKMSTIKG